MYCFISITLLTDLEWDMQWWLKPLGERISIHTHNHSVSPHRLLKGHKEKQFPLSGGWQYNGRDKLVQSTLYGCMELS
jgi:hypothetical protein